jgi:hypothetical protein
MFQVTQRVIYWIWKSIFGKLHSIKTKKLLSLMKIGRPLPEDVRLRLIRRPVKIVTRKKPYISLLFINESDADEATRAVGEAFSSGHSNS